MKPKKQIYDDRYYSSWLYRETDNSQRNRSRLALITERLNGSLHSAPRLLEVGCGPGGFLRLARQQFEVEGIDLSHSAIRPLREQFGEQVRVANIEQQPLPHERYQVVAAFNILEHLAYPERSVARIYDSLTPEGLLVGSVPNNQGLVGRPLTVLTNLFDQTHVSTFTPETWQRIFRHAGFEAVEFFGEVTFGHNHCRYIHRRGWQQVSFNLMFTARRPRKV